MRETRPMPVAPIIQGAENRQAVRARTPRPPPFLARSP